MYREILYRDITLATHSILHPDRIESRDDHHCEGETPAKKALNRIRHQGLHVSDKRMNQSPGSGFFGLG